jgi:hypothetical protein
MMKFHLGGGFLALLCGCAPLQQAPLVYASKVAIGVDLSATTTETPGMSITVGYKQVDAAYVPVAVAVPCDSAHESTKCTHENFRLRQLDAQNETKSLNQSPEAKERAQKLLNDFNRAKGALQTAELDKAVKKSSLDVAQSALNAKQSAFKAIEEKQSRNTEEEQQLQKKTDTLKTLQDAVTSAQSALANADAAVANAQKTVNGFDVKEIANAVEIVQGSNDKKDAYSVFGSFDSQTKAEVGAGSKAQSTEPSAQPKGEVGLVLGKVFSTGIASQNLTEGLRQYYLALAVSRSRQSLVDCLAKAEAITDATLKKSVTEACLRDPTITPKEAGQSNK